VTDPEGLPLTGDELFRAFVEATDALTYVLDLSNADGPPLYLSPQVERVLGRTVEELVAWPSLRRELVHPDDRERLVEAGGRTLREGGTFDEEFRIVMPDGSVRWLRDRAHVVPARDGRPPMWVGFAIDVTSRRERQEQASLDALYHRRLVEQLPGIMFRVTDEPVARVTYVSPQIEHVLGYPVDRWMDDPTLWERAVHPDDRTWVQAAWDDAVRTKEPIVAEYRMVRSDGRTVWLSESTIPIRDGDGVVREWQGLALDVTARRHAEVARETTEARYRALVEQLPAVVYVVSDDERPKSLYVSSASTEILGYAPEVYLRERSMWPRTIHPDDRDRVLAAWSEAVRTGGPFDSEYRFVRPDGGEVWVRDTSIRIEGRGKPTWQGVILDVTRRVLAEQEAGAAAARYKALVEGIPAVVYEMGPDDERRTIYVGPQVEALLGYSRSEWLDQPDMWIELLHPDDREIELAAHDHHNETGEPWRRDYRLIASDGRVVWVRDQAVLVRDADGRAWTWQGVMLDVTAQKEAEAQLRNAKDELEFRVRARTSQLAEANELMSLEIGERRRMEHELRGAEERYRRLVEDLPAVIYIWQPLDLPDGSDATYFSPQIEQLLGFSPSEWAHRTGLWRTRLHPHDHDRVVAATDRVARTGEPFHMEYRYLAQDGRVVWVLDRATLLSRDAAGRPLIFQGVMLDITARKLAEAKAAAAEERFREVVEAAPAITFVFELDDEDPTRATLDFVTPQIAEQLGYPVARWMDDPATWSEVIHPDDRGHVVEVSRASFASGAPWTLDYRVIAADGRIISVHSRARCAARDEAGRPTRFVGVLIDITDHDDADRRVRDDLATTTSLLEGMPGVPWTEIVDPTSGWRRFAYIGPQAKELFGYEPEELMGEPAHFERMVHPDDIDRVLRRWRRADTTGSWVDEYRVRRRDGVARWFHATARRITPEGAAPAVWQGITVDVTDLRRHEPPAAADVQPMRERR
jgi:PAS domain S-box-containing protein